MSDKTLEQMLEHLVNDDQAKAEELFHEYVVAKSREIYEGLIEVEEGDFEEEEDVKEDDMDMMDLPDDETGDLENEIEMDDPEDEEPMDDEEPEEAEELFQDLEDIVGELEAKFAELQGGETEDDNEDETEEAFSFESKDEDNDEEPVDEAADDEEEEKDDLDENFEDELASLREYVEKVGAPSNTDNADNKKSIVDDMKNDMGGTTANILGDKTDEKGRTADKPKEEDMGNINKPGGMKSDKMMNKASGGADSNETGADNTDSVLRSKRS